MTNNIRITEKQVNQMTSANERSYQAKQGKLLRAIVSGGAVTRKAITITVPTNNFIKVLKVDTSLSEAGISSSEVDVNFILGGAVTAGTPVIPSNFNDLYPYTPTFLVYEDSVVTGGVVLNLAKRYVNSTNQTSENTLYETETPVIFGSKSADVDLTVEVVSTPNVMDFIGIVISYVELDQNGNPL